MHCFLYQYFLPEKKNEPFVECQTCKRTYYTDVLKNNDDGLDGSPFKKDDYDNAMKFFKVYKLKKKDLLKHILFIFNEKMDKGNYIASTLLAAKFRLPQDKIMPAVKRAYEMNKQLGYIKQADE